VHNYGDIIAGACLGIIAGAISFNFNFVRTILPTGGTESIIVPRFVVLEASVSKPQTPSIDPSV